MGCLALNTAFRADWGLNQLHISTWISSEYQVAREPACGGEKQIQNNLGTASLIIRHSLEAVAIMAHSSELRDSQQRNVDHANARGQIIPGPTKLGQANRVENSGFARVRTKVDPLLKSKQSVRIARYLVSLSCEPKQCLLWGA